MSNRLQGKQGISVERKLVLVFIAIKLLSLKIQKKNYTYIKYKVKNALKYKVSMNTYEQYYICFSEQCYRLVSR